MPLPSISREDADLDKALHLDRQLNNDKMVETDMDM
jgi:hypothetical protein